MSTAIGVRRSLQESVGKLAGCHSRWTWEWRLLPTWQRSITPRGYKQIDKKANSKKKSWRPSYQFGGSQNSRHLLLSCGGEYASDPESGGESGNCLCLGTKNRFNFLLREDVENRPLFLMEIRQN